MFWETLRDKGLWVPATATNDDPPAYTPGDLIGPVDIILHEMRRRFALLTPLTTLFQDRIDYYENFPILDFDNLPALRIVLSSHTPGYSPGEIVENRIGVDVVISSDMSAIVPVTYGAPTVSSLQAYLRTQVHSMEPFNVMIDGNPPVGLVKNSFPGPVRARVEPSLDGSRFVWHNHMQWNLEMDDEAISGINFNVAHAGG